METGEQITRWTVRVAVAFYAASLIMRGIAPRASRSAWTVGCVAYLVHVAAAFEFYHEWSHEHAYAFTAHQSKLVAGLDWGGGLYVNYVFTLVWIGDAIWWWLNAQRYHDRARWIDWCAHGFLGFIVFNATVVFATGFGRWFGIAVGVLLASWGLGNGLTQRRKGAKKMHIDS